MQITVITPSFNQNQFIGRTLSSVAEQSHKHVEHLIFDPGSTDGSIATIQEYAAAHPGKVVFYLGEDKSQTNAINLGFDRAKGDIVCWLNSDDWFASPDVLEVVAEFFRNNPDVDLLYGRGEFVDADGILLKPAYINSKPDQLFDRFLTSIGILQPSVFLRKSIFHSSGPLDEGMNFAFDYEYWVRTLFNGSEFAFLDRVLSRATIHDGAKTMSSRDISLKECADVVRRYYGFVPKEWADRILSFERDLSDGIVQTSGRHLTPCEYTASDYAKPSAQLIKWAHLASAQESLQSTADRLAENFSDRVVTGFDRHYFDQGITLISSLYKHSYRGAIHVYDLGLSAEQRQFLCTLNKVEVITLPENLIPGNWYRKPKNYVYKNLIAHHAMMISRPQARMVWIDAGVALQKPVSQLFDLVDQHGCFFIDHDDRPSWPFYNVTFTTHDCLLGMEASADEATAPHLCSCLFGFRKEEKWERLILKAYEYSTDMKISVGDKHPIEGKIDPSGKAGSSVSFQNLGRARLTAGQIRDLQSAYGFFGHRQDQSIFSILAARYNAPVLSAKQVCASTDLSSRKSKLNYLSDGVDQTILSEAAIAVEYGGAVSIHHRGTYSNYENLEFKSVSSLERESCAVIGNGPSLRGVDLTQIGIRPSIGMNAAYRHWDKVGWYPKIYACLDLVVGNSHKEEILRLIKDRRQNGIELFLLRNELCAWLLTQSSELDCVVNFDLLRLGSPVLQAEPITTGSHSAAFASYLGFRHIYLMGIDCNYEEHVPGSKSVHGNILEIAEDAVNPNYFFEGYQRKGDRYNVPNPSTGLHVRAWKKVGNLVRSNGGHIFNTNQESKVDFFENASHLNFISPAALQPDRPRSCRAHVDETAVVSHMVSARIGSQHVMLDVGAHFGTSAQYFDKLGWTIYCFEPDPTNRQELIAKFGQAKNVTIDPRAVSDKPAADVSFFSSTESTGISGLSAFRDSHKESAKVDVTTVADIIRERNLSRVDFLKIDVEGFDFGVLKGVPWDTLKPDVVECEFEDAKTFPLGHTWKDIADFLRKHGYHVYVSEWHPIIRYGIPHDWRRVFRYPGPQMDSSAWGNFLAFREDPGLSTVQAAFDAFVRFRPAQEPAQLQLEKTMSSPAASKSAISAEEQGNSSPMATNVNASVSKVAEADQENKTRDGRVNMLQTPPPFVGRMWYSAPAHELLKVSPKLFTLLQFARRGFVHVSSRSHLLVLLLATIAATVWVSLDPQFRVNRVWMFLGGGVGIIALGLLYVAAKAQAHAAALHIQASNLEAELAALKNNSVHTQKFAIAQSALSGIRNELEKLSDVAASVPELKNDVARLVETVSSLPNLKNELAKLSGAPSSILELKSEVARLIEAASSLPSMNAEIAKLSKSVSEVPAELEPRIQATSKATEVLSSELAAMSQQVAAMDGERQKLTAQIGELLKQIESGKTADEAHQKVLLAVQEQQAGLGAAISEAVEKVKAADGRIADTASRLTTTEKWSRYDNATWFQHFNRRLTKEHTDTLDKEWRKRLSVPMAPATLGYMANRACEIEGRLEGRLATSIEDITLRSLVARAVKGKSVDVLEIGTLFGTGAAIMFDALDGHFDKIHFTLLDPLEGYYHGAQADILTGQRVDEHVVRKNLARAGMSLDQYTLIRHLSTEPEAMQLAANRKYDVLVIDGDHSYAGVKTDFENYASMVRVGGYIIFDDYNSPDWPDVKEYVDAEIGSHSFVAPVGNSWRTSVFRVVKRPAKDRQAT